MRFFEGPVIAEAAVRPEAWVSAFGPGRGVLVLAPASPAGWFGGAELVACDPRLVTIAPDGPPIRPYEPAAGLDAIGEALERTISSPDAAVTAALIRYDGSAVLGTFERGLARSGAGWHAWGDWAGRPKPVPVTPAVLDDARPLVSHVRSSADEATFCGGVRTAVAAMAAGDIYVLNLCRRVSGTAVTDASVTFATLLARSHASMGAFWGLPGGDVLSASPERFVSLDRGLLTVHPVKGTRPRDPDGLVDEALANELRCSEKERAEHVMVVDLERNDLGRVCLPGSVVVAPLSQLETTPYCHQLVSRVGGLLDDRTPLSAVLAATFPCGSVTGTPKRSAMEHIARIEAYDRAEYTGGLVVAIPGRLDSSVLIRTAVARGAELGYGVGCGITVDSDPRAEWEESVLKSVPLLGRPI